ncbi:hypothetical protein [Flavobacterium koreense]
MKNDFNIAQSQEPFALRSSRKNCLSSLAILLFLVNSNFSFSQNEDYYTKVLTNLKSNGYYLSINVTSTSYTGKIVIENVDLYFFFKDTKRIRHKKYIKQLKKYLETETPMPIDNVFFEEYKFAKVASSEEIEQDFKLGKTYFLEKYFSNRVLKKSYPIETQLIIIDKLFLLNILCFTDDESGALVIER